MSNTTQRIHVAAFLQDVGEGMGCYLAGDNEHNYDAGSYVVNKFGIDLFGVEGEILAHYNRDRYLWFINVENLKDNYPIG